VAQSSQYIEIKDDGASTDGATTWDTNKSASCQMYIANWSDTSISLVANVPISASNLYQQGVPLSPLSNVSTLTFFPSPYSYNNQSCPVADGDTLTFYVTNPQTSTTSPAASVCVGTPEISGCNQQ
jgi:hypothetical protein